MLLEIFQGFVDVNRKVQQFGRPLTGDLEPLKRSWRNFQYQRFLANSRFRILETLIFKDQRFLRVIDIKYPTTRSDH